MTGLHDVIIDPNPSRCVFREGYAFTSVTEPPNVYDAIVIRKPTERDREAPWKNYSDHALEEHIAFINRHKLEKARIVTDDLRFITRCPTLKYLEICPVDTAPDGFDFSPLYDMPEIRELTCQTAYGPDESRNSTVDYAKIHGLKYVFVQGEGHQNYNLAEHLERLWLREDKSHLSFGGISCSNSLKEVDLLRCGLRTLDGIERHKGLQALSLSYLRLLEDISSLVHVRDSLRCLSIENCPRVTDFSALEQLCNLEFLSLFGRNALPDLKFLHNMKKLKCFNFSMEVMDRDITPCLQVPYVWMEKGKKEYNLKDKDLPRQLSAEGFVLR